MIFVIITHTYGYLCFKILKRTSQNISYKNGVGFIWELLLYTIKLYPLNCEFEGEEMGEKTWLSKGILWIDVFWGTEGCSLLLTHNTYPIHSFPDFGHPLPHFSFSFPIYPKEHVTMYEKKL